MRAAPEAMVFRERVSTVLELRIPVLSGKADQEDIALSTYAHACGLGIPHLLRLEGIVRLGNRARCSGQLTEEVRPQSPWFVLVDGRKIVLSAEFNNYPASVEVFSPINSALCSRVFNDRRSLSSIGLQPGVGWRRLHKIQ